MKKTADSVENMKKYNFSRNFKLLINLKIPANFKAIQIFNKNVEKSADFDETMKFIDKVKFVIAYSFMYSPRPGTPAANKKQINIEIKKARLYALQTLLKEQQKDYNKSFVNNKIEILFDRQGRHSNQYIGRSVYNQSVFIESDRNLIGSIKKVRIKNSTDFALEGEINEK